MSDESILPAAGEQAPAAGDASATGPAPAPADATVDATAATVSADQVRLALRRVKDPELNLNIVDLGLVYGIEVDGSAVRIDMSLTSPGCPSGPEITSEAQQHAAAVAGVSEATVRIVWSPPWTPDRIEPRVRAYLGF